MTTKWKIKHNIFIFISLFVCVMGISQTKIKDIEDVNFLKGEYYLVTLKSKSNILGMFQERNGEQFIFQVSAYSKLSAYKDDIKHIRKVTKNQIVDGKYWPENNHANRYFFGQSAFNIRRNEINLSNQMGVQTALEYGISDHISISGGLNLFAVFYPDEYDRVNIFSTKVGGFKLSDNATLGFTGLYGKNYDDTNIIFTSVLTLGNKNTNFTLGLGPYIYTRDVYYVDFTPPFYYQYDSKTTTSVLMTLSGMVRVSSFAYLMTENWITSTDDLQNVFSFGTRFAGKSFSFDLALGYLSGYEQFIPYGGLAYKF